MKNAFKCPYCDVENSMQDRVDSYYRYVEDDYSERYSKYSQRLDLTCKNCNKRLKVSVENDIKVTFRFSSEKVSCLNGGKHNFETEGELLLWCLSCEKHYQCDHKSTEISHRSPIDGWDYYQCSDCKGQLGLSSDGKEFIPETTLNFKDKMIQK